jgi:hypothetical protein
MHWRDLKLFGIKRTRLVNPELYHQLIKDLPSATAIAHVRVIEACSVANDILYDLERGKIHSLVAINQLLVEFSECERNTWDYVIEQYKDQV